MPSVKGEPTLVLFVYTFFVAFKQVNFKKKLDRLRFIVLSQIKCGLISKQLNEEFDRSTKVYCEAPNEM